MEVVLPHVVEVSTTTQSEELWSLWPWTWSLLPCFYTAGVCSRTLHLRIGGTLEAREQTRSFPQRLVAIPGSSRAARLPPLRSEGSGAKMQRRREGRSELLLQIVEDRALETRKQTRLRRTVRRRREGKRVVHIVVRETEIVVHCHASIVTRGLSFTQKSCA